MIGSIASVPLPLGNASFAIEPGAERDPLQVELFDRHRIEVPIMTWPVPAALEPGRSPEARLLRISAQAYNEATQYERLARAVGHALGGTSGTTATAE
jgi:isopenicillin-N epimerase